MKNRIGLIVILVLLIAAYFLNPKYEKHVAKFVPDTVDKELRRSKLDVTPLAGLALKYNNYYLFSTTTNTITGERATFGIFGVVFR